MTTLFGKDNKTMADTRKQKQFINKIEGIRESRLLVYVTGDRQPFGARIAEDAVRPVYDHLLALEKLKPKRKTLDLFLYSRGGDVSIPWRLVTMFRHLFSEFNVIIPYKAHSAATMISLGADKMIMGRKAELSPIDPTLVRSGVGGSAVPPPEISVEDVSSYISFIKERANINDQAALAQLVGMLSGNLTPLVLGSVNRQYSHIRLVARKLLASHKDKIDEERLSSIVEALTEKMYSHGHAVGRKEAKEIGLPVEEAPQKLERLMWQLFEEYEKELELRDNLNPETLLTDNEEEKELKNLPLAVIESTEKLHRFETQAKFRKKRNVPNAPQININLRLGLPANINPQQVPQQLQQTINQIMQQIMQSLPSLVQQEIIRQSPIVGFEGRTYGGRWVEK